MTEEQMKGLRKSMKKFGYLTPIIIDTNNRIADGEHRATVYKELGLQEIPAIRMSLETDADRRQLRQVMNKLHGIHDRQMDADELVQIFQSQKFDELSEMIAQSKEDMQRMMLRYHPGLEFVTPENEEEIDALIDDELKRIAPDTALSDVYKLGEHRIICADATDERSVSKLLGENKRVDMVLTDPPYNLMGSSNGFTKLDDESMARHFFRSMMYLIANTLKFDGHGYICCNWRSYPLISTETVNAGLTEKNLIVWYKPNARVGNMYTSSHEFVSFFSNEKKAEYLTVSNRKVRTISMSEMNVWTIPITFNIREHFAEKPLVLCSKAIKNSSDENDIIFDPFLGSGSTLIACEQSGRRCYGMDISPRYIDVTIKRWEKYTGQKAEKL